MTMIKKIGIVSRFDKYEALELTKKIIDYFKNKVEIVLAPHTAEHIESECQCVAVDAMKASGVEFIVTIGGDGTVLRTISKMHDPLPLLAINMGTLGFLVEVDPEEAIETIENTLEGFSYVERSRLSVKINDNFLAAATNEIVLITARAAKILSFNICVDTIKIDELRADGVVIATPTGSTAYAMSAGGPIVDPRVNAILIVPLAPFKLSSRPWVVPGDSIINLTMTMPEKEAALVVDGQHTYQVHEKDIIKIYTSVHPARFIKMPIEDFFEKVKNKLS